jgi:hypothetical protein
MIVFDFIYFSLYTLVPDKAIFGKRDVACTYYSLFTGMFMMGLWMIAHNLLKYHSNNTKLYAGIVVVTIFGGLFVLIRRIYLTPEKFRYMHRKFRKIPKWLLKIVGIFYMPFCFAFLVTIGILVPAS